MPTSTPEIMRLAKQSGNGDGDQQRTRRRSEVFSVLWKRDRLTVKDIAGLRQLPRAFDPHPEARNCLALEPRIEQISRYHWECRVEYSSDLASPDKDENPLNWRTVWNGQGQSRDEPYSFDANRKLLVNTAGDFLLDGVRQVSDFVWSAQKNLQFIPDWLEDAQNSINSDPILLFGKTREKHTLRFAELGFREVDEAGRFYYQISFNIHFRKRTWDDEFLNAGRRELIKVSKGDLGDLFSEEEKARFKEDYLQDIFIGEPPRPTDDPVPLNEDGRAFRDISGRVKTSEIDPADLVFLKFQPYPEFNFSLLPLT